MKDLLYNSTAVGFVVLSLVCLGLIIRALQKILPLTNFSAKKQKRIFRNTVIALGLWTILMAVLSLSGFTNNFDSFPPRPIFIILSVFIFFSIAIFTPTLSEILLYTPPQWILYLQSFRFFVEILLWLLFIQNLIPVQMSFEGRNFDILVGITGPIFGYFCFVKQNWSKKAAFWWNIAGLALLFNILVIAVLSMPTPIRMFMNEPANRIVAIFPFFFLPSILVPIAFVMHIFSLRQLSLLK